MTPIEFYKITEKTLNELAKEKGISDLRPYYELTDYNYKSSISKYNGIPQVFAQMAFHAQNATMISNIVSFEKNRDFLEKVLCDFEPKAFLKRYKNSVENLVETFRFNEKTGEGLKWNSSKSKEKNKDAIAKRYANTLFDCANYLSKFKDKKDVLNDLSKKYIAGDFEKLIKYFRSKIKHGFSVALTCDFLKEFDRTFDLPKPDIHIKDVLCCYKGFEEDYYSGQKKEYECIRDMIELTKSINDNLPNEKMITVYQLDRMIWLICSGRFFLHNTEDSKSKYLATLK